MDGRRFDEFAKSMAVVTTRRTAVRRLGGGALGLVLAQFGMAEAAAQVEATGNRGEGDRCTSGRQCRRGLRCCDRRCRDILDDRRHCGRCNNDCRGGNRVCRNGGCFATCRGATAGVCDINGCGGRCGCNAAQESGDLNVCEFTGERCSQLDPCNDNRDCDRGRMCVDEGCCGGKRRVCVRPCAAGRTRRATISSGSVERRDP